MSSKVEMPNVKPMATFNGKYFLNEPSVALLAVAQKYTKLAILFQIGLEKLNRMAMGGALHSMMACYECIYETQLAVASSGNALHGRMEGIIMWRSSNSA